MAEIQKLAEVCALFDIPGTFENGIPYGTGHINDTNLVTAGGTKYIFQKINTNVFRAPEQLMDNMARVCCHLEKKFAGSEDAGRKSIHLAKSRKGDFWATDNEGGFWRAYKFIDGARTFDVIEKTSDAVNAAKAFGSFQMALADIGEPRLNDTIPDFHKTPKRLAALREAVKADVMGRKAGVAAEIDFVESRADICSKLTDLLARGVLPERITHNDTKLNNVLIDDATGTGICVIDLDTVMPGLVHYDFGDMVRTGTSPAAEDEKDLSKVFMRFEMFEALLRGYMAGAGSILTKEEKELMPFAGRLITLEIGIRFLTDYLAGDVYFRIHRPEHNLDRCRTQFKLVESIEEQMNAMQRLMSSVK